jgi:hypothetical protein
MMNRSPLTKKIRLYCLLYLTGMLVIAPAWANDRKVTGEQTITDGRSLVISCEQAMLALDTPPDTPSPSTDAFICMAYLSGIMAATQHANERARLQFSLATEGQGNQAAFNLYCFNWQLSYQQITRIVLNYAHKNPGYLQRPAQDMVMRALQNAFPCQGYGQ